MSVHTFRFLAVAALADGRLDEEEKPVLLEAAVKFGLTRSQAGEIVRELAQGRAKVTAVMPKDPSERAELFRSMIEVVAADGRIAPREEALFCKLAPQFNVEEEMVGGMMQAVRDALTRPTQRFKPPQPPPPAPLT